MEYESFNKSLPYITKADSRDYFQDSGYQGEEYSYKERELALKLRQVLEFEKTISGLKSRDLILHQFEALLKRLTRCSEFSFFIQIENKFSPYLTAASERTSFFIDNLFSADSLKRFFAAGITKVFRDSFINNIDGSRSSYLVSPVLNEDAERKLFVMQIPASAGKPWNHYPNNYEEIHIIQLCLQITLSKIEFLSKQDELNKSLSEMQAYQSKLANDYKLSAIGELTSGIVEEILSPLQVIGSAAEFLRGEDEACNDAVDTINNQVRKVKNAINSLVRFAGNNDAKFKVQPCQVNELIREFYSVVVSSLKNDNYECILDLEENLPPVLSQSNAIQQILTNIFTLLRKSKSGGGGIFIQTKFKDENVIVRLLTTDFIEELSSGTIKQTSDVSLKIVNNIITKHEGSLFVDSNKSKGTIFILTFPIKRRIGR